MARQKIVNNVYIDLTDEEIAEEEAAAEEYDLDINRIRMIRDSALRSSDYTQLGDASLGDHTAEEWATYRTAMKDLPQNYTRVSQVVWPEDPPTAKVTRKRTAGQAAYNAAIASDPEDTAAAQAAYDTAYAATD